MKSLRELAKIVNNYNGGYVREDAICELLRRQKILEREYRKLWKIIRKEYGFSINNPVMPYKTKKNNT